jgi:hypothetical protein
MKNVSSKPMLPVFRQPLSIPARMRTMPDAFDRARLAVVAMLAGFVLVALALFSHVASSSLPLPLGGDAGQGTVLTTSRASSAQHTTRGTLPTQGFITPATASGAAASIPAAGSGSAAPGSGAAGAGNAPGVKPGGQIGVSVGSGPTQTSPVVVPASGTTSTGTSSGTGSGTGTGSTGTGTGTGSTGSTDDPATGLPGDSTPPPSDPSNGHGGTTTLPTTPLPGHDPAVPSPGTTPGSTAPGSGTGSTTGTGTAGTGTGTGSGITPLYSAISSRLHARHF